MNEWKPLTTRITLLPMTAGFAQPASPLTIFKSLLKAEPDSFNKSQNPLIPGTAHGQIGNLQATITSAFSRTDIQFGAVVPSTAEGPPPSLTLIEEPGELFHKLNSIAQDLGVEGVMMDVGRVALFAQFVSLQDSIRSANEKLTEIMPKRYAIKLDDEEDVVFQVNRQAPGRTIPDSTMNFIRNWSVARFQVLSIAASIDRSGVSAASAPVAHVPQTIGASISIEANNTTLNRSLTAKEQGALLIEEFQAIREGIKSAGIVIKEF